MVVRVIAVVVTVMTFVDLGHSGPQTVTARPFSIEVPSGFTVYMENAAAHNTACEQDGGRYARPVAGDGWDHEHPLSRVSLVCIGYPHRAFPGTTFNDAALQLMEITNLRIAADCESFAPPPGLRLPPYHGADNHVHREEIGGLRFLVGSFGGVATTHVSVRKLYRSFQAGRCYEFSENIEYDDYAGDSGELPVFATAQEQRVLEELTRILLTMRLKGDDE